MLLGRFGMADGRPADHEWAVAEMCAHFRPGTVPILSGHRGVPVGVLDTLTAQGRDLAFTGTVVGYTDLAARLRRGVPVSVEVSVTEGGYPPPAGRRGTTTDQRAHYRGALAPGWNLVGVALLLGGERPAAPGSLCWLVVET